MSATRTLGAMGLGCALLTAAACEDRQVALITLDDLPEQTTGLGVYSRLTKSTGTGPWQSAAVAPNSRFGIEVPIDVVGQLEAQVFAYKNGVPCILASGQTAVDLPGKYRQDARISL